MRETGAEAGPVRAALVLPHGGGVRTRTVEAWALGPGVLLDLPEDGAHPSR